MRLWQNHFLKVSKSLPEVGARIWKQTLQKTPNKKQNKEIACQKHHTRGPRITKGHQNDFKRVMHATRSARSVAVYPPPSGFPPSDSCGELQPKHLCYLDKPELSGINMLYG